MFTAPAPPTRLRDPFARFAYALSVVLSVSKAELDRREAIYQAQSRLKKNRPGPKPKRVAK